MNREDAEEYTQALALQFDGGWRHIAWAHKQGIPDALGLTTKEWAEQRLGGYKRLSIDDRREAVTNLTDEGYSLRETGEILGISHEQARRDVTNVTPTERNLLREMSPQELREENEKTLDLLRGRKAEIPQAIFNTIVIDPPWEMEKIERKVAPNQVGFDYPTMTEGELNLFPVSDLADSNCHLFCWATQKFLPSAFRLIEHWGFKYIFLMVWHKPGGFQPFGLPQYNSEFVVYGRKGTPKFREISAFCTCFQAERREHSRKPDVFYDLVRRVTDGPRIDIFSREKRDGFDQYGNETDKFKSAT